ncbi:MAG: GerW family sporulation protein [Ktedonobacteraceae bacterium]
MIEGQKTGGPVMGTLDQVMRRLLDVARADAVFGQPVERRDTTIIPCSEMSVGLGLGGGGGFNAASEQSNQPGGGGSGGGGGGANGRPVAVIVMSQEGVRIEPIMDLTKIALASLTTGAFVLFWLARLGRATRDNKRLSFPQLKKAIGR